LGGELAHGSFGLKGIGNLAQVKGRAELQKGELLGQLFWGVGVKGGRILAPRVGPGIAHGAAMETASRWAKGNKRAMRAFSTFFGIGEVVDEPAAKYPFLHPWEFSRVL